MVKSLHEGVLRVTVYYMERKREMRDCLFPCLYCIHTHTLVEDSTSAFKKWVELLHRFKHFPIYQWLLWVDDLFTCFIQELSLGVSWYKVIPLQIISWVTYICTFLGLIVQVQALSIESIIAHYTFSWLVSMWARKMSNQKCS